MAESLFDPSILYQMLSKRGLLPEWAKQRPDPFKPTIK